MSSISVVASMEPPSSTLPVEKSELQPEMPCAGLAAVRPILTFLPPPVIENTMGIIPRPRLSPSDASLLPLAPQVQVIQAPPPPAAGSPPAAPLAATGPQPLGAVASIADSKPVCKMIPASRPTSILMSPNVMVPFDGCDDMLKGRTKLFHFAIPVGVFARDLPSAIKIGERMEFLIPSTKVKVTFRCICFPLSTHQGMEITLRSHGRDRHAMTCPSGLHFLDATSALVRLGPDDNRYRYTLCNSPVEVYAIWERYEPGGVDAEKLCAGPPVIDGRSVMQTKPIHSFCRMTLRGRNYVSVAEKLLHKNPSTLCKCCHRENTTRDPSTPTAQRYRGPKAGKSVPVAASEDALAAAQVLTSMLGKFG